MALTIDITKDYYFQQGEKIGEKRGFIKTATRMLGEGLDKALIAKLTSLSMQEIDKLEKDLQKKKKE
jgi:hypothetical protein